MKRALVAVLILSLSPFTDAQPLNRRLAASAVSGSTARAPHVRYLPDPGRIVIEFDAAPVLARDRKNATAAAVELGALFARLERDLATIGGDLSTKSARTKPASIAHRYSLTFAGAAAQVAPEAVERIRQLPYVRRVHPDRIMTALLQESVAQVGATQAWSDYGVRGAGVVVAVIDTGIDYSHPAFGNGFGPGHKVRGGHDYVNDDADPMDDAGHGTHVAGIVAANGGGLLGVAPDAELLAYKVLDQSGSGRDSSVLAAIEEVARVRPDIANMSLGRPAAPDDPVVRAIENASAAGVLFCVAAGNSGRFLDIGSPGLAPSVLTVGASDREGRVAPFSSKGPVLPTGAIKPEVVAPGVNIVSSYLHGATRAASGTSMASPHVAGVAALLRSIHPQWSGATIRSAIISGTRPVDAEVMAAGAGVIHAVDAAAMGVFTSRNTLAFGVSDQGQNLWKSETSFTVTNSSDATQALALEVDGLRDGIALRASESSLSIAPGASVRIDLELEVDHTKVAAPRAGSLSFGGLLRLKREGSTVAIPWSFVRAARVRVAWTGSDDASVKIGTTEMMVEGWTSRSAPSVELFIGGGPASIWLSSGFLSATSVHHVVLEDVDLTSNADFTITPADAPHRLIFNGTDLSGRSLSGRSQSLREIVLRHPHFEAQLLDSLSDVAANQQVFLSNLSERTRLFAFERAFDVDTPATWIAQYEPVTGVAGDVELTVDAGDWTLLPIRGVIPKDLDAPYHFDWAAVWVFGHGSSATSIARPDFAIAPPIGQEMRIYMTRSRSSDSATSVMIEIGEDPSGAAGMGPLPSPDFFAEFTSVDAGIIPGHQAQPRLADRLIPAGEPIVIGDGPAHPNAMISGGNGFFFASVQWIGPHREDRTYDTRRMTASLYDEAGKLVAEGTPPPRNAPGMGPGRAPAFQMFAELPAAGLYRLEAVKDGATYTATIDSRKEDATAPALTSFRINDGAGRTTSFLDRRSASVLTFSAVDLSNMGLGEIAREKTTVQYRAGNSPWTALTAVELGESLSMDRDFGRLPDGILYRADLSSATSTLTGAVDLRISVEDASGNKSEYVLAPAFVVSGRRRAAAQPAQ